MTTNESSRTQPPGYTEPKVFDFINLLRGIASLTVFYYHLVLFILVGLAKHDTGKETWIWHLIEGDFSLGRYGVAVFFLVSGFLIPSTLRKTGMTLRRFTLHRVFRLYPAYWVSIAAVLAVNLIVRHHLNATPLAVLANLTMLQGFVGQLGLIGVFWTLKIELIFYVLCALLFAFGLINRRRLALVLVLAGMIGIAYVHRRFGRDLLQATLLPALSLMVLGDVIRGFTRGEITQRSLGFWTAMVMTAMVPSCLWIYGDFGWGMVLANWAAIATFLAAYRVRDWIARTGPIRTFGTFFGDISYSLYLLHMPIGIVAARVVFKQTGSFPLACLVGFAGSVVASWFVYHWVEVPGIRMGRRLGGESTRNIPLAEAATIGGLALKTETSPVPRVDPT